MAMKKRKYRVVPGRRYYHVVDSQGREMFSDTSEAEVKQVCREMNNPGKPKGGRKGRR